MWCTGERGAVTVCQVQGELPGVGGTPLPHAADPPGRGASRLLSKHFQPCTNLSWETIQEFGPTGPAYWFPFSSCPLPGCSSAPPHLEQRAALSLMPPESLCISVSWDSTNQCLIPRQFLKLSSLPLIDSSGSNFLLSRGALGLARD